MTVSIDLPIDIETELRKTIRDIDRAGKEAMLVEFYRGHRITHFQLAGALGLSRYETDGVLKRHHVSEDLPTVEDFDRQIMDTTRATCASTFAIPTALDYGLRENSA